MNEGTRGHEGEAEKRRNERKMLAGSCIWFSKAESDVWIQVQNKSIINERSHSDLLYKMGGGFLITY